MYNLEWDKETGGYILVPNIRGVSKEIRPVFYEELNLFGFRNLGGWEYPECEEPLLWAETRRYFYRGEFVAEAIGGGLYSPPEIKVHQHGLKLEPVDLTTTVEKNRAFMEGIVSETLVSIYDIYKKYRKRGYDFFYVAFSGGKDSVVLLDLVSRAIPHDEFAVVFGDTTMEVEDTYKAIELAQQYWSNIQFFTAKAQYDARESWKLFGPPSRTQRWCCSVHKSAPSLLLLRQLVGRDNINALVYDGIRAEESDTRATYDIVSDGRKHITQSNCRPILEWNSAEIFLYIFGKKLLFNKAYRYGCNRVGCAICPLSSSWREYITNRIYENDTRDFLELISDYVLNAGISEKEHDKYIDQGKWKTRMGGKGLANAGCRVTEQHDKNSSVLRFYIQQMNCEWKEWMKAVGELVEIENGFYMLLHKGNYYPIKYEKSDDNLTIEVRNIENTKNDIHLAYLIRNVVNKTAYCVGCKVCEVECPKGALSVENGFVSIDNEKCIRCESCCDIEKGCLVARSLYNSVGRNNVYNTLKGMDRYRGFGFRRDWLRYFFDEGDEFWKSDKLGKDQFVGVKVWLKEAEITENNLLTELGSHLAKLGADDIRTWAIMWTNLAYNSTIVKWYILNTDFNVRYEHSQLINMLSDDYSERTRLNALRSLEKTFEESPIGEELGSGICDFKGRSILGVTRIGWQKPDDITLLYSLYKFAEKMDGYYSFTLSGLADDNPNRVGISPAKLFGVDQDDLKRILQGLAFAYPDYIKVAFSKDLDNIFLESKHSSVKLLNLLK